MFVEILKNISLAFLSILSSSLTSTRFLYWLFVNSRSSSLISSICLCVPRWYCPVCLWAMRQPYSRLPSQRSSGWESHRWSLQDAQQTYLHSVAEVLSLPVAGLASPALRLTCSWARATASVPLRSSGAAYLWRWRCAASIRWPSPSARRKVYRMSILSCEWGASLRGQQSAGGCIPSWLVRWDPHLPAWGTGGTLWVVLLNR